MTDSVATLQHAYAVPAAKSTNSDSERTVAAPCGDTHEAKVRELLPLHLRDAVASADVCRFVRATGGNLPLAAKRLAATMQWREEHRPHEVVCKACQKDCKSHYMHVIGHDALGRPIIYSCLAAAKNKNFQDNHDHMIMTFENAIRLMPPGVDQWVWVCDFTGFGIADVNPKLARAFLNVSAEHYPERLGMFLVVDAPTLFGVLWKAISSFVDPKTYNKIRFLPVDLDSPKSSLRACLNTFCAPDVTQWISTEIKENRDTKKVSVKAYSVHNLGQPVSDDEEPEQSHNHHGTPQLRRMLASSPALLQRSVSGSPTSSGSLSASSPLSSPSTSSRMS